MRLQDQLRTAFENLSRRLQAADAPFVRERELVSLFAFGPLLAVVHSDGELFDARQIGIEVAVPQRPSWPGERLKVDVCKDLVIWERPEMTCWGPDGAHRLFPRAVLEWKAVPPRGRASGAVRGQRHGELWLQWMVNESPASEGYSVLVRGDRGRWTVCVDRYSHLGIEAPWFATP
ncbi:MAG TPA: hypothetical protein VIH11_05280 [Gemmatimonadaceae bacterium]|nr:hypothetical protein [Gemmatimonadaceae bacterium]